MVHVRLQQLCRSTIINWKLLCHIFLVATSLEAHDIARIRPSKSIRLLEVDDGGPHRVGYTLKDYILQQQKMRTLSSDAATIQKFFSDTQTKDDEFFYLINPNNSARLRNVV